MEYLAYIIIGFALIQLAVATANLIFKPDLAKYGNKYNNLISVLIPARNEEKNIGNLLSDLIKQDYRNIEILVFDDQSTDSTAKIVTDFGIIDNRIKLVHSEGLPNGWLGKNYACHSLSKLAKGERLLFLDADVRVGTNLLQNTLGYSLNKKLGLLTIFPKQIMNSLGERMTVPNMNYILLSLLSLALVRKSKNPSLAAANGQFMLFDSTVYFEFNPHETMKSQKVEDIEIARYLKKSNIAVACLTGNNTITCKMYDSSSDAVNGFAKNVISFFGNSFLVAILFWAVTTFGFIAVLLGVNPSLQALYLFAIIITRIFISIVSHQNIIWNLLLIIPQQLTMGQFIYKAFVNKLKKQHQWKGRNIL